MAAPMNCSSFSVCRILCARLCLNGQKFTNRAASTTSINDRTPQVAVTSDQATIICWHPEPTFPYEYTKKLPRKRDEMEMGDSVLKVSHRRDYYLRDHEKGPSRQELAAMFYTSKHQWYPINEKRFRKPFPPRDRPYL